MGIRIKTIIIIVCLTLFAFVGVSVVAQLFLINGFERVETAATQQDVQRVVDAIKTNLRNINAKGTDWTYWEDTYQFAQDRNQAYIDANLSTSIVGQGMNFWMFYNAKNQLIYTAGYDIDTIKAIPAPASLKSALHPGSALLGHNDTKGKEVVLNLSDGPMLVVSRPILHADGSGPSVGTLILATKLDASKIKELSNTTHLSINIYSPDTANLPDDVIQYRDVLSQKNNSSKAAVSPLSSTIIAGYTTYPDGLGNPGLIIRIKEDRHIYQEGQKALRYTNAAIAIFGITILLVLWGLLNKFVSGPISRLAKDVNLIRDHQHTSLLLKTNMQRNDEIGNLANSVNGMLASLKKAHFELEEEKSNVEQKVIMRTKELNNEKARLHASIDSLMIGYLMTDANNGIILVNRAAQHILSTGPKGKAKHVDNSQIEPEQVYDLLSRSIHLSDLVNTAKTKQRSIIRKSIPYYDRFINIYITPILSEHHSAKALGTVVLIEDCTEQKILDRSRDEFFSIASHELRTPLTAIRGNTSLIQTRLRDEIKNPMVKDIIADIYESSVRLIHIVNDFLDVGRLEQGKIRFEPENFDIVELCSTAIREYNVTTSRKKLYLRVIPPKHTLPFVFADKNRVRQVVVNLIGNGLKFTDEGGVELSFEETAKTVNILISDTGIGIAEQNLKLLFRKFQQAESNIYTRDTAHGTGLGLYISRGLMESMGGTVEIVSTAVDQGSTFRISLPKTKGNQTKQEDKK